MLRPTPHHASRESARRRTIVHVGSFVAGLALAAVLPGAAQGHSLFSSYFLSFDAGNSPRSVAVGDLNADGIPDLAVANGSSNTVSVLAGIGDGTFGVRSDFATGYSPVCVRIGDLNGDGIPDLVAACAGSNSVTVLLGLGTRATR